LSSEPGQPMQASSNASTSDASRSGEHAHAAGDPAGEQTADGKKHPFGIHDEDPSTTGGPPGWLAFAIIFLLILVATVSMVLFFAVT